MQTLAIEKVSVIRRNKEKVLNLVVIRISGKPAIIRTFDQFTTDLKESFLVSNEVTSMNDPEVMEVLADLQGGTVRGDVSFHKAGDEYTIDENHPAMTNPNHRHYGKVQVGTKLKAEKDGARVTEGFLTLKREVTAQAIHKSANSYASMRMKFEGFIAEPESVNSAVADHETEDFQLEEDLKKEIVGEKE